MSLVTSKTNNMSSFVASECVKCFSPQNCLADNICAEGTTGPNCEKCAKGNETGASTGRSRLTSPRPCIKTAYNNIEFKSITKGVM